jgi:ankyrin repeat protein
MLAAQHSDAGLVVLLLQAGADPRRTDHHGLTAANHARRAGHEGLARLIEAAGKGESVKAGSE